MAEKAKFRCYICGEDAKGEFLLISLNRITDRPFVVHVRCLGRADDEPLVSKVSEIGPRPRARRRKSR